MRKLFCRLIGVVLFSVGGGSVALAGDVQLAGAGSAFAAPFFFDSLGAYSSDHSVDASYQALGNGLRIQLLSDGALNFIALDVPLRPTAAAHEFVEVPIVLGGVGVVYNLPGVKHLKLSGAVLGGIYLGKIRNWRDSAIRRTNPHAALPDEPITVFHESAASGSSYEFTDFLSRVSSKWRSTVGTAELPVWPYGMAAKPARGMNEEVNDTRGAIGYEYTTYAALADAPMAQIRNRSGKFIGPTAASISDDARHFNHLSTKRFIIVDGAGASSYPISGYTWMVVCRHQSDAVKGRALVALMHWLVTHYQTYAAPLGYSAIPSSARWYALRAIDKILVAS